MSATHFWHPFADMAKVAGREVVMRRGEGLHLWDADGRRYLDATSSLWYCNVGYGRAELAEAGARQLRELAAFSTFGDFTNAPAEELATAVCELSPMGTDGCAFFASGGSDAIDTAAKIARRYWTARGEPQRTRFVARAGGYHGVNAFGTSLGGLEPNRAGYGPLVGDVTHVPFDDYDALERAIDAAGDTAAAIIGEPVLGAAGVLPPPDGYWEAVSALARDRGVLLIADEVITGFGRVGHAFASERFGIDPDLIVGAKGITSSYLPLGVVIAASHIKDALWSEEVGLLRHGYTYSGHPTVCAVALANLRVLHDEGLFQRVRDLEGRFAEALDGLLEHPLVKATRSVGYMGGVELAEPTLVEAVVAEARRRGVLVRNLMGRTLQVSPPLIAGPEHFDAIATTIADSLSAVARSSR